MYGACASFASRFSLEGNYCLAAPFFCQSLSFLLLASESLKAPKQEDLVVLEDTPAPVRQPVVCGSVQFCRLPNFLFALPVSSSPAVCVQVIEFKLRLGWKEPNTRLAVVKLCSRKNERVLTKLGLIYVCVSCLVTDV